MNHFCFNPSVYHPGVFLPVETSPSVGWLDTGDTVSPEVTTGRAGVESKIIVEIIGFELSAVGLAVLHTVDGMAACMSTCGLKTPVAR